MFLEFAKNIQMAEISQLLDILKRHRNPLANDDGDIATTLWHYRFDHIHYEAADIFAMEAIQFELSMFKVAPGHQQADDQSGVTGDGAEHGSEHGSGQNGQGLGGSSQGGTEGNGQNSTGGNGQQVQTGVDGDGPPSSLVLLSNNKKLVELDPEEQHALEAMVRAEEGRDYTSDVVDILLITLSVEADQIDFAAILEFLEVEFFEAMAREDFSLAFKISQNVLNISRALKNSKPWSTSLINFFFASLEREDRFLEMSWLHDYRRIAAIPDKNRHLLAIFKQLSGEAIIILGMLAAQIPSENISLRYEIMDIISSKVRKNVHSLGRLMKESGEETVLLLLPVLEKLEMKSAAQVYQQMTLHPSPVIRRVGVDGFFQANRSPVIDEIRHILQDPDESVREKALLYMGKLDNKLQEELLISFLGQESSQKDDGLHILQCYRLLSRCLSPVSYEFLRNTLLGSGLKSMFSHSSKAHKAGAAYVLKSFGTKEAMQVLREGAESMRPDIRQICRKALEH